MYYVHYIYTIYTHHSIMHYIAYRACTTDMTYVNCMHNSALCHMTLDCKSLDRFVWLCIIQIHTHIRFTEKIQAYMNAYCTEHPDMKYIGSQ